MADVTSEMHIMQEEVFGPVMLLARVKDDAEAVAMANQISYALGSSVFSKDHARARRIASEVEAGMVAINEFGGITYMAQDLTFGGIKASGFGRMNGREGLRSMCNVKAVMEDRFPIHQPSKVFPVAEKDYGVFSGVIELIYGRGLKARWRGLMRLISGGKA